MKISSIFFCLLFSSAAAFSQYTSLVHYGVKEGLLSSTVYVVTQDSKGFIWIGTDAGLTRYDGTNFKSFTTMDGLPDNEVLGLLFDSKTGKMWIITYSKEICYYQDGQIHTRQNDSVLRVVNPENGEYLKGNVQVAVGAFFYSSNYIYSCKDNKVRTDMVNVMHMFKIHEINDSTMDVLTDVGLCRYVNNKFSQKFDIKMKSGESFLRCEWLGDRFILCEKGLIDIYDKNYEPLKTVRLDSGAVTVNVVQSGDKYYVAGAWSGVYALDTSLTKPVEKIWKGTVNTIFADAEANIWISTRDDGITVLKSHKSSNYNKENGLPNDNISSLALDTNGTLYIGNTHGEIFTLDKVNNISKIIFDKNIRFESIRGMEIDGHLLYILANEMMKHNLKTHQTIIFPRTGGGPKSILKADNGRRILFGLLSAIVDYEPVDRHLRFKDYLQYQRPPESVLDSFNRVISYRTIDGKDGIIEERFFHRIMCMAMRPDGRLYCGSLEGAFRYDHGRMIALVDSTHRIAKRIASIAITPDSLLWIGTASDGIMAYSDKVLSVVNAFNHLSYCGTICRKVIAGRPGEIWVATNGGVNRIKYSYKDTLSIIDVTPLTSADGLLSDDVNEILLHDSLLYVGTARGLSILNVNELSQPQPVNVYIMDIKINDKDSAIHDYEYELSYWQNNLRIQYIGVSPLSGGFIRYQYRLLNSSDKWVTTTNNSIELRSLSPGRYTFEVVVLDKFGNRSRSSAHISFHIYPAYYQTVWFWAIVFICFLGIGFYVIRRQFRARQDRYEHEQKLNNKIVELEQQALKAQMNPHFIFNCLTAIQHFVNREDLYSANMYLSNFAKLIRQTLDLSGEQYITLDKEVNYLNSYIKLEQMRFPDEFTYTVNVDKSIDEYSAHVPPMLLQPIIENAIRHGLRYKRDRAGILTINFIKEGSNIVAEIDDNGIGMTQSKLLKTNTHVEYQSKGMTLTLSRINAINMMESKKISMDIKEKMDSNSNVTGTLITFTFEQ